MLSGRIWATEIKGFLRENPMCKASLPGIPPSLGSSDGWRGMDVSHYLPFEYLSGARRAGFAPERRKSPLFWMFSHNLCSCPSPAELVLGSAQDSLPGNAREWWHRGLERVLWFKMDLADPKPLSVMLIRPKTLPLPCRFSLQALGRTSVAAIMPLITFLFSGLSVPWVSCDVKLKGAFQHLLIKSPLGLFWLLQECDWRLIFPLCYISPSPKPLPPNFSFLSHPYPALLIFKIHFV